MTTSNANGATTSRSRFTSMEFIGEVILLIAVAAFFIYMYLDSVPPDADALGWLPWRLEWDNGGWLLPRIAVLFGTPFWFWRAYLLFKAGASSTTGQIMDTGFLETDDDPMMVLRRWFQLIGTTGALLIGLWVFGFHIAVPAYTILYLIIFGKVKWYWTLIPAVFFEVIIIGIYGYLLLSEWGHAGCARLARHRSDMGRRHRRLAQLLRGQPRVVVTLHTRCCMLVLYGSSTICSNEVNVPNSASR